MFQHGCIVITVKGHRAAPAPPRAPFCDTDASSPPSPQCATVNVVIPVSVRRQLQEAAIDCKSMTFHGASARVDQIKRVAFEVAGQFRRTVMIEINGSEVVVSFFLSLA
jgi:hypothetical protein